MGTQVLAEAEEQQVEVLDQLLRLSCCFDKLLPLNQPIDGRLTHAGEMSQTLRLLRGTGRQGLEKLPGTLRHGFSFQFGRVGMLGGGAGMTGKGSGADTAGNDAVTASYPGDINNAPDPETVIQVVNGVSDSAKLRQMQMAVMPVVTNMSGAAISGAIDNAISAGFGGFLQRLILPSVTLSVIYIALIARMTRASVLEVLGEDYIRTARAKGQGRVEVDLGGGEWKGDGEGG